MDNLLIHVTKNYIMENVLIIKGCTFHYNSENLTWNSNKPMIKESAIQLMKLTDKLLCEIGIEYYLGFGTLLGAVRENGNMINGDEDIDIYTEQETILYDSIPFLYSKGLKLIRYVRNRVFSFKIEDGAYIDVYIVKKLPLYNPWNMYCLSLDGYITPKRFFKDFQYVEFLGIICKCSKNPENILEFWYGKDWKTPISGHKFYYEVKSAYYWHWIKDRVLKKLLFYDYWQFYVKQKLKKIF